MVYIPASLNKHINWAQALPILDIEASQSALPFTVQCPLCGSHQLSLYQDTIFGGTWGYCFKCEFAGDLLELAAATLGTTLFNAAVQLSQGGIDFPPSVLTPEAVSAYAQNYLVFRDRVDAFWAQSQQQLANDHIDIRPILRKFNFRKDLQGETWIARGGQYIGACTAVAAAQVFAPKTKKRAEIRMLRGQKWKIAAVIPFQDLPGRICGFLFIGGDGNPDDFVYRSISQSHCRNLRPIEAGLCMYDTTWRKTTATVFDNTTFVLDNVLLALRLQLQHLNDHRLPLPIVATHNVSVQTIRHSHPTHLVSEAAWRTQPHRRYVFWAPRFTTNTIDMAANVGGRVFVGHIDTKHHRLLPKSQLRKVFDNAKSWETALKNALVAQAPAGVAATLKRLNVPNGLFSDFVQRCPRALQQVIADCGGVAASCLTHAYYGQHTIEESAAGWIFKNSGRVLSRAILRIERIIHSRDCEDYYYQGNIIFQDQVIPFVELGAKMDKHALKIMTTIIAKKCGISLVCDAYYNKCIVNVAKQFHPPRVIVTAGTFGWDVETGSFMLPQFSIHLGGSVDTAVTPFTDTRSPGLHLKPPTVAMPPLTAICDNNEQNRIFWAVTANIAANVLAPALNHPTAGIGLVGQGANNVGPQTAIALGCQEMQVQTRHRAPAEQAHELQAETSRHNWPIYIRFPMTCRARSLWLTRPENKNVVMAVDAHMRDALALQAPWRYVISHPAQAVPTSLKLAHGIMPHWLRDVAHRHLELESNAELYVFRVLEDIAKWLERRNFIGDVVRDAGNMIEDTGDMPWDRAVRLVSLLYTAITDGLLELEQSDFPEAKKRLTLVRIVESGKPLGIFVARRVVHKLLTDRGLAMLDSPRITEMLANAGALLRELEYNGDVGWVLAEPWWQEQFRTCRARLQQNLRIVG